MRALLSAVAALVALACGCSSPGEEEADRSATTRAVTTTNSGGSGGALADLFEAVETSRCADAVLDAAPPTAGGKAAAAIARDVERLRGLRFDDVPRPRYATTRAIDRRVRRWLEQYPDSEAAADGRTLEALGALPPGSDLEALLGRSLAGQVAGFYDPESEELVVDAGDDRALDGVDRVVLAHELEHALADQALGLPDAVGAGEAAEGREDAALAALALVEGDATLVMEAYALEHLSFLDALRSLGPALASEGQLAALPHHVEASMLFPYTEGLRFVCELFERGGWRAVDRAYRSLPASSAEILFPERYGRGERPADPPDPPAPGGGWRRIDRQAFGAADLLWLFEAPGGDDERVLADARERVEAWAGGEVHAWARGDRTAVALRLVQRPRERSLCASMKAWQAAARIEAALRCVGRHVRIGIAPDVATAARLVSS